MVCGTCYLFRSIRYTVLEKVALSQPIFHNRNLFQDSGNLLGPHVSNMMSMKTDTLSIVQRCKNGDRNGFVDLFREHGSLVAAVAMRMAHDRELQKEIVQEVMARVFVSIGEFHEECKFTTWLYRVTVNVALRLLDREQRNRRRRAEVLEVDELPGHDPGALSRLIQRETVNAALDSIADMPDSAREIFSLFYFAELRIDEICEQTGKSESAVKAVLFKGRKKMIERLNALGLAGKHESP
jgi:RNA polymerase sigma-70 factor, ECF subfamily